MKVDVIFSAGTQSLSPSRTLLQQWAKVALTHASSAGFLTLKIVDIDEITQLNTIYRQKEKPTNVLSFPCRLPDNLRKNQLGDIALCATVIAQEAIAQHKSREAHWAHMVIHGVLHLLGYDHETEEDALVMEDIERTLLKHCGFADPYVDGHCQGTTSHA